MIGRRCRAALLAGSLGLVLSTAAMAAGPTIRVYRRSPRTSSRRSSNPNRRIFLTQIATSRRPRCSATLTCTLPIWYTPES